MQCFWVKKKKKKSPLVVNYPKEFDADLCCVDNSNLRQLLHKPFCSGSAHSDAVKDMKMS